ncbi:Quino protein alcohol dehydrogenase-like protein [Acephala macrosclerotiorum]|nr:Quino protein alcohol dehydrogenase-like protein [Acephala macrosclerotiorum]
MLGFIRNVGCSSLASSLLMGLGLCPSDFAHQHPFFGHNSHGIVRDGPSQAILSNQIPASQPPPSQTGNWLGWGGDVYNNHWASSDAVVDSSNVASLALACQKKYNPGVSAAPLVVDGIAYFPTWNGLLVALDYRTCHTLWKTNITDVILEYKPLSAEQKLLLAPVSRTTPVIGNHGGEDVLYIGTLAQALLLAIDKNTGKLIDALQLETHPLAILTMSPTFYQGHLFMGVSSLEEGAPDLIPDYKCCSFTGSMHAVSFEHGRLRLLWSQPMIPANSNFTGAAVWGSQPAIDPIRNQVFIATGNSYSLPVEFEACQNQTANITVIKEGLTSDPCLPPTVLQETVLALDLDTGRVNWLRQLSPLDAWNSACVQGIFGPPIPGSEAACPSTPGPDADFGMAPTFVLGSEHTPFELDVIVVGQKNGNLYALNAATGFVLWSTSTGPDGLEGGLNWGIAVDDASVYYTAININRVNYTLPAGNGKTVISNSAFGAASLKDGHILWQTAAPRNTTSIVSPAVVNDVVLTGISGNWSSKSVFPVGPGSFLSLDKTTGRILKEVHLDAYFHGSFAIVHDYVMFGSGYGGLEPGAAGSFQVWKL